MDDKKRKIINLILVIIAGVSSLFAYGISIIIAISYLFIERKRSNNEAKTTFIADLKKYWWLVLLPVLSGVLTVFISRIILPEFYLHVLERVKPMLALDKMFLLILELLLLSLLEEIVYRRFLQNEISKMTNPIWGIFIASVLFAVGHYSAGAIFIVLYDLTTIFIDSVIFGMIYEKTKNVYICWISHFIANFVGMLILLL